MSRSKQTWIIVGALFLSVATLVYFFAPQRGQREGKSNAIEAPTEPKRGQTLPDARLEEPPGGELPSEAPAPAEAKKSGVDEAVATGVPYSERFDDVTLTFVPIKDFRRLVEWRQEAISKEEDFTCTEPYTATETVTNVTYAWGFVIERFNTWSEKEGQQEYLTFETAIPRVWQGSLHDIVQEGRRVRVTKQRCGMGQVAGLVSVRP